MCAAGPVKVASIKRQLPPINEEAPRLSKKDYYTIPAMKKLRRMTSESLKVWFTSFHSNDAISSVKLRKCHTAVFRKLGNLYTQWT